MMRITITGEGKGKVFIEYEGPVEVIDLRAQTPCSSLSLLSPREKEVLPYLLKGYSYKEIGELLFISPYTVKIHVHHIYEKCQVKDRTALIHQLLEYLPLFQKSSAMAFTV